jgi:Polyketide cyclase / dehydrase and lipid transport
VSAIAVSIVIDALPDDVWKVLEPVENHVDWMADAEAIRFTTEQTRGVGTKFLCDTKVGPIRMTDPMEITEWEPGHAMGVRHTGIVSGVGRFTLSQRGPRSTNFIWRENLTFPWWLGGPIAGALGGKVVLKFIWNRNLKALKQLVEATS